jgi:hypothetical protein
VLSLIPQLMALKDSASAPVVRPPWNDTVLIKRLLDAGCHNFLIPFVETAAQARSAVAATRYRRGRRGVSVSQAPTLRHRSRLPRDRQRQHLRGADRERRRDRGARRHCRRRRCRLPVRRAVDLARRWATRQRRPP